MDREGRGGGVRVGSSGRRLPTSLIFHGDISFVSPRLDPCDYLIGRICHLANNALGLRRLRICGGRIHALLHDPRKTQTLSLGRLGPTTYQTPYHSRWRCRFRDSTERTSAVKRSASKTGRRLSRATSDGSENQDFIGIALSRTNSKY